MSNSIETVSLVDAAEQLKSKIRLSFVELLPEEQWKAMVLAELERFTKPGPSADRWGNQSASAPSEFSQICKQVFSDFLKEEVKKTLVSPEWSGSWGPNGRPISDAIKSWLTENSAALVQATVQALAGQAAQQIIHNMAAHR